MTKIDQNKLRDRERHLEIEIARLNNQLTALEAERDRLAFILDSIPDYVSYVDTDLTYRFCNKVYSTESGQPIDTFIGKHVVAYVGKQGLAKIQPHVDRVLRGVNVSYDDHIDYRYQTQQDVEVRYTPHKYPDNSVQGFSVYVRNITAQRRAEEMLLRQAQHDPLTDLPNRTLFNKRLAQAMSRAKRINGRLAIMFIDLDGFKQVNDEMGHEVGDQVLQDVADTLVEHLRVNDTLARIGGDEFVLLVEDLQGERQVECLANKLIDSVAMLETPALNQMKIGSSIGIALYPDHAENASELLNRADEGMYEAKRQGKNRYFLIGRSYQD